MRDLSEHRRLWEDDPGYRYDSDSATGPVAGRPATARIDEDHEGLMLAGGTTGAVVGGIIGGLAGGPAGAAIGVAVGAAAGGAAGVALDYGDVEPAFYDEWQRDPIRESVPWEHAGPAYRHGWEGHDRPELRGRTWDEAHPDLRQHWKGAPWTTIEPLVRSAWNRRASLTGAAHGPAVDPPADGPTGPEPSILAIPRRSEDRT
jgi:hypothetical protein